MNNNGFEPSFPPKIPFAEVRHQMTLLLQKDLVLLVLSLSLHYCYLHRYFAAVVLCHYCHFHPLVHQNQALKKKFNLKFTISSQHYWMFRWIYYFEKIQIMTGTKFSEQMRFNEILLTTNIKFFYNILAKKEIFLLLHQ